MNLNKPTDDEWPITTNELTQLFDFYKSFADYIKT